MRSSVVIQFPHSLKLGRVFACLPAEPHDYWTQTYPGRCETFAAEGDRRDRFMALHGGMEFWVRWTLEGEYDGARVRAGRPLSLHHAAVVVAHHESGAIRRMFVPVRRDYAHPVERECLCERYRPSDWWHLAERYFAQPIRPAYRASAYRGFQPTPHWEELAAIVERDALQTIDALVRDTLLVGGGCRP